MKKLLFLLLFPVLLNAQYTFTPGQIKIIWRGQDIDGTYYQPGTTFRVHEINGQVWTTADTFQVIDITESHKYYVTAIFNGLESGPSDTAAVEIVQETCGLLIPFVLAAPEDVLDVANIKGSVALYNGSLGIWGHVRPTTLSIPVMPGKGILGIQGEGKITVVVGDEIFVLELHGGLHRFPVEIVNCITLQADSRFVLKLLSVTVDAVPGAPVIVKIEKVQL